MSLYHGWRHVVSGGIATLAIAVPTVAVVTTGPTSYHNTRQQGCARQFDRAVRSYVNTTQNRDAEGFNALLHRDVTVVFANGGVLDGKTETANFIHGFFADPGWTQSFNELKRHVSGCDAGFVLFDSVYSVPAEHRVSPLVIGVTFTYQHGRWRVLHNQDSTGPAS